MRLEEMFTTAGAARFTTGDEGLFPCRARTGGGDARRGRRLGKRRSGHCQDGEELVDFRTRWARMVSPVNERASLFPVFAWAQ